HDAIIKIPGNRFPEVTLDAGHLHRREKTSVRELRQSLPLAADPRQIFPIVIPGGDLRVTDGPLNGNPLFLSGLEIEIAPAIALAAPHDGFSSDLAAANPGKMLSGIAGVRVFLVVDEELMGIFVAGVVALALDRLRTLALVAIVPAAMFEFPN